MMAGSSHSMTYPGRVAAGRQAAPSCPVGACGPGSVPESVAQPGRSHSGTGVTVDICVATPDVCHFSAPACPGTGAGLYAWIATVRGPQTTIGALNNKSGTGRQTAAC